MRINRALNLVFPVETAKNGTLHIHAMPISRTVFEQYFLVLSKAFSAILQEGLSIISGPRVAFLMLRQIATDQGVWDAPDGVERGLVAEIRRLTNVAMVGERGWETLPYQDILGRSILDPEDIAEIEGVLVFFTCASLVPRRDQVANILASTGRLWGGQTTSLSCSELAASLPTSTATGNSGATAPTLSVPS